jgi:hypothetical protein
MSVSRIVSKYLRALEQNRDNLECVLGSDEGLSLYYDLDDDVNGIHNYIVLKMSTRHIGVSISAGPPNERFYHQFTADYSKIDDDTYEHVCTGFVELSSYTSDAYVNMMVDSFMPLEEIRSGPRHWTDETTEKLTPKMRELFALVKHDTPLLIEYMSPGGSSAFNCGSIDSWDYPDTGPEECEEVATALEEVRTAIQQHRQSVFGACAVRIQSCYRGWCARMNYAYNPSTSLGKFYLMREFNQLMQDCP